MCLRTISIFFSVNYLFIIFAHYVLIVDLSFIGWQGALYVLEIPFLDMSFRLNLSHNVAYGVYHACHEKKRSHTVMWARHCTLSCACSHVLLPLALWGLLLGLSALGPQWRSLPIYSRLGARTFLAAWEILTFLVLVWSFASCGPHYFSS